jgi:hypothetical protein
MDRKDCHFHFHLADDPHPNEIQLIEAPAPEMEPANRPEAGAQRATLNHSGIPGITLSKVPDSPLACYREERGRLDQLCCGDARQLDFVCGGVFRPLPLITIVPSFAT